MSRPDRTEAKEQFFKLLKEGLSVAAASRQVGVHNKAGYYWAKKFKHSVEPVAIRFAELKSAAAAPKPLEITVGGATIKVESCFDAQLLRQVVAALSGGEK